MKLENKNIHSRNFTYLSILKYVSNNLSGENIALGLLAVSPHGSFYKISQKKLALVKRLNPEANKLLNFSLTQLNKIFKEDLIDSLQHDLIDNKLLSADYLNRLSIYNNGILQFSSPQSFDFIFDKKDFEIFFQKFIGRDGYKDEVQKLSVVSGIKKKIQDSFYKPLRDKIDLDYTLHKNQLPSLYFDFVLDGIGVNGALYAVKSIDINAQKNVGHLKSEISEFESVIERLNNFGLSKGLSTNNQYHLVFEEYKGNIPSLLELESILKENNMPLFKVSSEKDLDSIASNIIKSKAGKFSEKFALDISI